MALLKIVNVLEDVKGAALNARSRVFPQTTIQTGSGTIDPCAGVGCTPECQQNCPVGDQTFRFNAGTIRAAISRTALTPGGPSEYDILRVNTLPVRHPTAIVRSRIGRAQITPVLRRMSWRETPLAMSRERAFSGSTARLIASAGVLQCKTLSIRLAHTLPMSFKPNSDFREIFWDINPLATNLSPSTKKITSQYCECQI